MKKIRVEYKGRKYDTAKDLAKDLNISYDRLLSRLSKGWSVEDAVEIENLKSNIVLSHQGKTYASIQELCDELELSYNIFSHHLRRYEDVGYAIEKAKESMCKEPVIAFGKEYKGYAGIVARYGLTRYTLIQNINKGMSIEDAILKTLETEKIIFNGKQYKRFHELCAEFKMQPSTVRERIYSGYSLEEALNNPIRFTTVGIQNEYRGKQYPSKIALCRAYGISVKSVSRLQDVHPNLTFTDIVDCYVRMKEYAKIPFNVQVFTIPRMVINGKPYDTLRRFANEIDISESILNKACELSKRGNLIEQLKAVQEKTITRYLIDGKYYQKKELKNIYSFKEIQELEKCKVQIPAYQMLQGFNFNDRCYDTHKILHEFIEEYEELYQADAENQGLEIQGM